MAVRKKNIFNYFPFKLILLVTIIAVVSFLSGIRINAEKNLGGIEKNKTKNATISKCDSYECLFNSDWDQTLQGYGQLIGYYKKYKTTVGYGSTETIECDAFIPVRSYGNLKLYDALEIYAENKATVRYDSEKNLLVNIDLVSLDVSDIQKMKASNYNSLVTLKVIKLAPSYREVSACESSLDILSVKNSL